MAQKNKQIQCGKCRRLYMLNDAMTIRAIEGHKGIVQHLLICPHCQDEVHSHFSGDELEQPFLKMQAAHDAYTALKERFADRSNPGLPQAPTAIDALEEIDQSLQKYYIARDVYQRKFDRLNKRMKKKFGMNKER